MIFFHSGDHEEKELILTKKNLRGVSGTLMVTFNYLN